MAKKKPFALRLDPEMLKSLEKWAADEFRSVNGQIEYLLAEKLREHNRHPAHLCKNCNNKKKG